MRYLLVLVTMFCFSVAQAEVFKCVTPAGDAVFADTACDNGEQFEKVRPSESVSDPELARRELERQRAYAAKIAAENEAARKNTSGAAALPELPTSPMSSPDGLNFPSSSSSGNGPAQPAPRGVGPQRRN
jgi:hypothetical protein